MIEIPEYASIWLQPEEYHASATWYDYDGKLCAVSIYTDDDIFKYSEHFDGKTTKKVLLDKDIAFILLDEMKARGSSDE